MNDRIRLGDDGTLDTVLVCQECGEETRYTFSAEETPINGYFASSPQHQRTLERQAYETFVEESIADFDSEHECPEPPDTADLGEL